MLQLRAVCIQFHAVATLVFSRWRVQHPFPRVQLAITLGREVLLTPGPNDTFDLVSSDAEAQWQALNRM